MVPESNSNSVIFPEINYSSLKFWQAFYLLQIMTSEDQWMHFIKINWCLTIYQDGRATVWPDWAILNDLGEVFFANIAQIFDFWATLKNTLIK